MPKLLHDVIYTGDKGEEPAFVVAENPDGTVDIASWDGNGWVARKNVPEKKPGGEGGYGHTWKHND